MKSMMGLFYGGDVMGKAKIISVINYKGGVGKTVSAFNIAAGLNFLNNHSALLIDLDPQCSLSTICMRAYSKTKGKHLSFGNLMEEETINHVFTSYLNKEILDFEIPLDLNMLIKKDFYTGGKFKLNNFDFIPSAMLMSSNQALAGLENVDAQIKQRYGEGGNSTLHRLSILAKFIKEEQLDELYDFIIFDCPPTNNFIVQNALFVSDYYLVPTVMDEMGVQGIYHVKNIVEGSTIKDLCRKYKTFIKFAPDTSYLSFLKNGTPEMIGILETLRKATHTKGGSEAEQWRRTVETNFKAKLFDPVIYHQVNLQKLVNEGECCFINWKRDGKLPANEAYGKVVLEILNRLNIEKYKFARQVTDIL